MGGCTMTKVADTIYEILEEMKQHVYDAIKAGLWPDSELIILNPETEEVNIYLIKYTEQHIGEKGYL